jgi:hypothetical protein
MIAFQQRTTDDLEAKSHLPFRASMGLDLHQLRRAHSDGFDRQSCIKMKAAFEPPLLSIDNLRWP